MRGSEGHRDHPPGSEVEVNGGTGSAVRSPPPGSEIEVNGGTAVQSDPLPTLHLLQLSYFKYIDV